MTPRVFNRRVALALGVVAFLVAFAAAGQSLPAPPAALPAFEQRLGASVPLTAGFTDADGRPVTLQRLVGRAPVILALGYYRCPQLCGLLMHGLLEAMQASGLARDDYRIVFVSIDAHDTPTDAAARRQVDLAYARFLEGVRGDATPLSLDLLVGPPASIDALTRAVGYRYATSDDPRSPFAHPAGLVVLTREGRVSRYVMGIQPSPDELRDALADAAADRIGSPADRLALLCAHLDLRTGAWTSAVLWGLRALGLALVLALASFAWHARRRPRVRL